MSLQLLLLGSAPTWCRLVLCIVIGVSFAPRLYADRVSENAGNNFLNQNERSWLQQLPASLKVGITLIPNQVLLEEGHGYKGYAIDLFRKLEHKLDARFEYVFFDTWDEVITAARNKQIDIVFLAQKTESRLSYLEFTDTVLILQNKIIVHIDNTKNGSMEVLSKAKIAVSKGSAIQEYLLSYYPDVIIFPVKAERDALAWVANGSVDAAISEAVRASYYIERADFDDLRIADNLGYDYHLGIASRNDWPILNVILSKAVNNIPDAEIEALQLKWGYAIDEVPVFDTRTLIYLIILFSIILLFSLYLYITNKRLHRETLVRKQVIEDLQVANSTIHELMQLAENEARTDELTQIANKRRIQELLITQIDEYKHHHKAFSLLLIDIDYFKKINDSMGHHVGDEVLVQFAVNVSRQLRKEDLFGRIGGEEFAIILPDTRCVEAAQFAEELRVAVGACRYRIDGHEFSISFSGGIAEVRETDTLQSLLKRADELLYRAKALGRNKVCVQDTGPG